MASITASLGKFSTGAIRPKNLLDLPKEIRLEIYDWVFYSTTLFVERQEKDAEDEASSSIQDPHDVPDGDLSSEDAQTENLEIEEDEDGFTVSDRAGSMFVTPEMTEKLNLVCRIFNEEIGQSWHSKVTYDFPCTVAFLDVLGQWSQNKLEALRYAHVCAYPLPLYPIDRPDCYTTHFFPEALPMVPGLRLNLLTVENVWLEPDGEGVDGWCLGATSYEVEGLLESSGWKELEYISGTLGLLSGEVRELNERIGKMKQGRNEEGYSYTLGPMRPRLSHLVSYNAQGNVTDQDGDEAKAEVAKWEADNPEYSPPKEETVTIRAKRGTDEYAQTGEGRAKCIKGLLDRFTWVEIRESRKYLVGDGIDDHTAHL